MDKRKVLFVLAWMLTLPVSGRAQTPFVQRYPVIEGGRPVEAGVEVLVEDNDGYLWVGTDRGLFRYDGEHFTLIEGSSGMQVTALYAAPSGIWAGFVNGSLGCVRNPFKNKLEYSRFQQGGLIQSLYVTAGDSVWVGGEQGLNLWYRDTLRLHLDKQKGLSDDFIYSIQPWGAGRLLLGTDRGLNRLHFDGEGIYVDQYTTQEGLPDNIVRVIRSGNIRARQWLGLQQSGLVLYSPDTRQLLSFPELSPWTYGEVNDILAISDSLAWVITDHDLLEVRLDIDGMSARVRAFHYADRQFRKLICDHAGNIWIATESGIDKVSALYLNGIKLPAPYRIEQVTALAAGKDNVFWLAQGQQLYALTISSPHTMSLRLVFESPASISCLYIDYSGRLWLGTLGDGLWWRDTSGRFHSGKAKHLSAQQHILSITGNREKLWVAGLPGLSEFISPPDSRKPPRFIRHLGKDEGTGSDYIYFLLNDRDSTIWIATDGAGIRKIHYSGNFGTVPYPSLLNDKVIYSMSSSQDGTIWAGTPEQGLYYFHPDFPEKVQHKAWSGLNFSGLTANPTGQVFLVFERGLAVWYPESRQFRHFNRDQEGGPHQMPRVLNCIAQDPSGNVYIPYEDGLLCFPPQVRDLDVRPNIFITRVHTALDPNAPLTTNFSYDQNYFNFIYEGINFTNPERLRYRYKLEGLGTRWIYTRDESVTFPNLPPGHYIFRVQSSLDDDFSLAREASFTFSIMPPFWRRPLFLMLVTLAAVLLIYGIIKGRERHQRTLHKLRQERMHFEYEQLKSQVNPHFLFNSLNTLGNMIEDDSEAALAYTESLSDLYKNILKYRNRDLIVLEEELAILEDYLTVQQYRFGNALQCTVAIPDTVRKTKKIIPMGLQMLVENAIKHNIVSQAQPLKINILSENGYVVISNPVQLKISPASDAGVGLENIQRRYGLLSKRAVMISGSGNRFIVKLPLL